MTKKPPTELITELSITMEFLNKWFEKIDAKLDRHMIDEDHQIEKISKLITDWQIKHDADSKERRTYAEKAFVKKDSLKLAARIIWTSVATVWVIVTAINYIHPLFKW